MMKIALIGYGKMGKAIEQVAVDRGHEIVARISSKTAEDIKKLHPAEIDVAIEFTTPDSAPNNIGTLLDKGIRVVSGSTGWLDRYDEMVKRCETAGTSFLYASNFSIGVNITFAINEKLAQLLNQHHGYEAAIHEVHHTSKKDAPSGTAISLARGIAENHQAYDDWKYPEEAGERRIPISSDRVDPAPGTHVVSHRSAIDTIQITHTAHSRAGFAAGAVLAAEYIADRKGIYTMKNVLSIL